MNLQYDAYAVFFFTNLVMHHGDIVGQDGTPSAPILDSISDSAEVIHRKTIF